MKLHTRTLLSIACLSTLCIIPGCTVDDAKKKMDLGVSPISPALAKSAAFRDTIGSCAYYEGLAPQRARGYGLVVGLGKNGSGECPRAIRDQLIQSLYKQHKFSGGPVGEWQIKPEQLIDDPDTAVVVVRADIPGAVVEGTRVDVYVTALPGTKAKSLRGGRLFTTELESYRETPSGILPSGTVVAKASGPLLLNPFAEGDAATQSAPLEATIVGGGRCTKARDLRLVLGSASYGLAQKIQDRINNRFPKERKVADAISPSYIDIHIPKEFHDDTGHFLALLRSLFLTSEPNFEGMRAKALAEELVIPNAPHDLIALALEGLGQAVIPLISNLYSHQSDHVSFHAAVAGSRLGDHLAVDALALQARKIQGEFRFKAIRAMAQAKGMANASIALRELLEDDDPRIQAAAYEALVERRDAVVRSKSLGGDNFTLDLIPTHNANRVYAKRSQSRRIALFGEDHLCDPPVHYVSPDGSFTVNALPEDKQLTLIRVALADDTRSPPIPAPLNLSRLIELLGNDADIDADGQVTGLGLDYGSIIRALQHLCEDRSINASFMLEQPNAAELFGPTRPQGRPESEL
ncbi:MAG: flagellar basal body P-ring protein FlgI [Planctomycetota bacterium]